MVERDFGRWHPTIVLLDNSCIVLESHLGLIVANHLCAGRHGLRNVSRAELVAAEPQVPDFLVVRTHCLRSLSAGSPRPRIVQTALDRVQFYKGFLVFGIEGHHLGRVVASSLAKLRVSHFDLRCLHSSHLILLGEGPREVLRLISRSPVVCTADCPSSGPIGERAA